MAWHPYAYPSAMFETNFVSDNAAMFSTMALNGDSNIPVYFTEFGISNINTPGGTESEVTAGLLKLLDEIQDNMPQVVGTMLYRGVDSGSYSGTGTADWGLLKTDLTRKGRDASFCAMTWCSPYVGLFNFNNTTTGRMGALPIARLHHGMSQSSKPECPTYTRSRTGALRLHRCTTTAFAHCIERSSQWKSLS